MLALTLGARLIQVLWALPGVLVPWLGFARPPADGASETASDETIEPAPRPADEPAASVP